MFNRIRDIIGILFFCCWVACPAKAALKDAEEFFLDNGLQVVVVSNHKAPIIKHVLLYKAGRVDEPYGKGGIAHLLEHLMFRGTKKFKDGKFNQLIENNGGESNAATGHDYTYYHQFLNIDRLELAMYLEADRMTGLSFDDKTFEKERGVVYQERQERFNSNSTRDFWEKTDQLFWRDSLYGKPIGGTSEEIKNITKQDVLDFYQNFYAPNNAVLVLSGDIDVETARDLAQKYYGKIPSRTIGKKGNISEMDNREYRLGTYSINAKRNDLKFGRLSGRYLFPRFRGDEQSLYAMVILAEYLGNSVVSPLYKKLRLNQQLATAFDVSYDFLSQGNSVFALSAYFKKAGDESKIQDAFMSTLAETINKMTEKDLEQTKKRLLAGIIYNYDNPSDAANIIISWLGAGYTLKDIQSYEENIKKTTLSQVKTCASTLLEYHPLWAVITPILEKKQ